jgi:Repeat of unknown function (DUF5648)
VFKSFFFILLAFVVSEATASSINWPPTWPHPNPSQLRQQAEVYLSPTAPVTTLNAYDANVTLPITVFDYLNATAANARFLGWYRDGSVLTGLFVSDKFLAEAGLRPASIADSIKLPPLAPGSYTLRLATGDGPINAGGPMEVRPTTPSIPVTVMGNRHTGKFFMTSREADVGSLLSVSGQLVPPIPNDGGGPHWGIAERPVLRAWLNTGDAPTAAKPVCRFFHPTVSTHFYSADEVECALLRRTPPFIDEGVEFRALMPTEGVCPVGAEPVYRLFNASLSNHRYTRLPESIISLSSKGWRNEGAAFCSPLN